MKRRSKVVGGILILILLGWMPFQVLHAEEKITGNNKRVTKMVELSKLFNSINIEGDFEVTIVPGTPSKVIMTADENIMPYLQAGVSDGVLNIKSQPGFIIRSTKPQTVEVTTEKFRNLTIKGKANLQAKQIKGESLNIHLLGNSVINLAGEVKQLNLNLKGNATVKAQALKADEVTVNGTGNADITVSATSQLHMSTTGRGSIKYYGAPAISQTTFGTVIIQKLGN